MRLLIVSCSLSAGSRSRALAKRLASAARELAAEVELVDLRDHPLPLCDGGPSYADEQVQELSRRIADADAVVLAVPVYNYDVGGAARNLVAMTGKAWAGKVVGFLAAAGGERSYMPLMPLANSLMLDFRCTVVPRFVYASSAAFEGQTLSDEDVAARIDGLAEELHRFSSALAV